MNNQREIIYEKRNKILDSESIHDEVLGNFKDYITELVNSHTIEAPTLKEKDYEEIVEACNENLLKKYRLALSEINGKSNSEVIEIIYDNVLKDYNEKLVLCLVS